MTLETDWVGEHFAMYGFDPSRTDTEAAIVCVGASFRATEYALGRKLDE